MKSVLITATLLACSALSGCIGLKSGGEGVFEPTAVQPPSFERGSGIGSTTTTPAPAPEPEARSDRRGLTIPNR